MPLLLNPPLSSIVLGLVPCTSVASFLAACIDCITALPGDVSELGECIFNSSKTIANWVWVCEIFVGGDIINSQLFKVNYCFFNALLF